MNSKTLKYISYFAVVPALIIMTFVKLKFLIIVPFAAISYLLKLSALKKAKIENRDSVYMEAIEKDIDTSKWAVFMILGLAVVKAIYRYS